MTTFRKASISSLLIIITSLTASIRAAEENAVQALQYYFDLVTSENFESAGLMWSTEAQERSSRFGVQYSSIPVRVDATSPIIRNLPVMKYHLTPAAKQVVDLESGGKVVRLEFSNVVNDTLITWFYYARRENAYYTLIYPQDHYCRNWKTVESRYFRIHAHPDRLAYLNPAALAEADHFVDRLSDSLRLPKSSRADLANSKIEYFYCASDSTLQLIAGRQTKGLLDLASNDVISAEFPHFHEIAHLLINISLKELPLQTLPLIREGMAVRYGGRWGKRATALLDLGVYLYKEKIVELDSVLTVRGFDYGAGADIAYPVAGLFNLYMSEKLGLDSVWAVYRRMSTSNLSLDSLGSDTLRLLLTRYMGAADWSAVLAEFQSFLDRNADSVAVARPGLAPKAREVIRAENFVISRTQDWVCFEISADTGEVRGNIMFLKDSRLDGQRSALFEEQYGADQAFAGFRYGMRFDRNEAGLYDYATNELVAKYIWGITPSEEYYDEPSRRLKIRFRANLLDDFLSKKQLYHLLPL